MPVGKGMRILGQPFLSEGTELFECHVLYLLLC